MNPAELAAGEFFGLEAHALGPAAIEKLSFLAA